MSHESMTGDEALHALAAALGVHTSYVDGLRRPVQVAPETLVRVCAALGAQIKRPEDAPEALRALKAARAEGISPVLVAWDGLVPSVKPRTGYPGDASLVLEDGRTVPVEIGAGSVHVPGSLPMGYHTLTVEAAGEVHRSTVISAPERGWRRPGARKSWGVGTHLAALRSRRSRAVGDLTDLESVFRWVGGRGGDLVTVLPLLPTFNGEWPEPSPYSPVSRLFWSELVLDLGTHHRAVGPVDTLDVRRADAEVRAALAGLPVPAEALRDPELVRYARFRGASARLGRNWREWPAEARDGDLGDSHVDPEEERFHLVAQMAAREQLEGCLLYTSPSPRDRTRSRMPSSA